MSEEYGKPAAVPNPPAHGKALFIDEEACIGCNMCVNMCRMSLILPNPEQGGVPIVMYPDECWFCGVCASACPVDAIRMEPPVIQYVGWKRKETGEFFRVGMKIPPPPNQNPPVG
jgi:NAD-dependent dihydropyrimidine dehydrogenase PreA subunit